MAYRLQGKKVAVLATEGFEQAELIEPRKALEAEGGQAVVVSPMRDNPAAVRFVKSLISRLSLRADIRNAGGNWVDQEVAVDNGLVTSRKPDDIPAFNRKTIEEIAEGRRGHRKVRTA